MCSSKDILADRQAERHRHTDRHAHRNIPLPYGGGVTNQELRQERLTENEEEKHTVSFTLNFFCKTCEQIKPVSKWNDWLWTAVACEESEARLSTLSVGRMIALCTSAARESTRVSIALRRSLQQRRPDWACARPHAIFRGAQASCNTPMFDQIIMNCKSRIQYIFSSRTISLAKHVAKISLVTIMSFLYHFVCFIVFYFYCSCCIRAY